METVQLAFLFALASSSAVACATPPKSLAPEGRATMRTASALSGPECPAGGPTVTAAITSHKPGKPPHYTFVADLRVLNPTNVPVWLLYDVGDDETFPSVVTSLFLSRTSLGREGHVWSFFGDGGFETVRIPGEARLLLRDAELSTLEQTRPPVLVLARRITVDGRPAEELFGRPDLLPPTGDLDLKPETRQTDLERQLSVDGLNAPALQVDVLCVSHVDLAAPLSHQ